MDGVGTRCVILFYRLPLLYKSVCLWLLHGSYHSRRRYPRVKYGIDSTINAILCGVFFGA